MEEDQKFGSLIRRLIHKSYSLPKEVSDKLLLSIFKRLPPGRIKHQKLDDAALEADADLRGQ